MEIFETLENIPENARHTIMAIGNFDGVHRGHQELLRLAGDKAAHAKKPLSVLTFEPHPRRLFRSDDPPFRITPFPVKVRKLKEGAVDFLFSIPFDWDFASQTAEQFIDHVLKNNLRPAHIVVGDDFRFGQLRKGTPEMLKNAGFQVTVVGKIADESDDSFSSSRIRAALRHAEIGQANKLLGWEWEIEGIVTHGDKRGRELGFPTTNVPLGETMHPAYGVYAAWVQIEGEDEWLPSATNIGIRPMFELAEGQVEAHILDFDRDIYGKTLRIKPVKHLRGEAKFDDLDALTAQIQKDCEKSRAILNSA